MKNIFKQLFLFSMILALLSSCKKDEHREIFSGNNAPVLLTASESGPLVLNIADKALPAIQFNWNNPEYHFNTGISSQDVFYTLQMDVSGSNFSNATIQEIVIPFELNKILSVGELNAFLLSMNLEHEVDHDIDFRVRAALANNAVPVYSNTVSLNITPYLDVKYPVPANLYITGAATPAGWQCACGEPELLSQKFTQTNAYTFELVMDVNANESYLFLPVYGSWAAKYGFSGAGNGNNVNGDDFNPGGNDIKAPAIPGSYKITVDFKTGRFTLLKL